MKKVILIIIALLIVVGVAGLAAFLMIDRRQGPVATIAKASAEFKANQNFRYEPAKKLVPQLKIGMTTQDVEALLGKPNKKHDNDLLWHYTLGYSQFISVGFDPNGIVQKFGGAYAYLRSKENRGN
jgi:outer membrane protein assembly factor BamE (lipoprotein component of BamABCDE complex)